MTDKEIISISVPKDLLEVLDDRVQNRSAHIVKLLKMDLYGEERFEKVWKEDKKSDLKREAEIQANEAEALKKSAERKRELAEKIDDMETDQERERQAQLRQAYDVLSPSEMDVAEHGVEGAVDQIQDRHLRFWADKIGIAKDDLRDKLITHLQ